MHHTFLFLLPVVYASCVSAVAVDDTHISKHRLTFEPSSTTFSARASLIQDRPNTRALAALRQRANVLMHSSSPVKLPERQRRPRLPGAFHWRHEMSSEKYLSGQRMDNGKQTQRQPGSKIIRPFKIRIHYTACSGEQLHTIIIE